MKHKKFARTRHFPTGGDQILSGKDQIFLEERPNIVAGKRLTLSTADSMLFEVLHTEAT